jgi:hypothetical protein
MIIGGLLMRRSKLESHGANARAAAAEYGATADKATKKPAPEPAPELAKAAPAKPDRK